MLNDLVSSIGSDEFDAEIQFHSVGWLNDLGFFLLCDAQWSRP
jgi:hypothetical protein